MNSNHEPKPCKTAEEALERLKKTVGQLIDFNIPLILYNKDGSFQTTSYCKFFGIDQEEALEDFIQNPDKKIKSINKIITRYQQEDKEDTFSKKLNPVIEKYRLLQKEMLGPEHYLYEAERLAKLIEERLTLVSRLQALVGLVKFQHEEYLKLANKNIPTEESKPMQNYVLHFGLWGESISILTHNESLKSDESRRTFTRMRERE